jgi:hypothetical protein
MGTRAVIARWTDQDKGEWAGQYHHWDGYPSALGATLYQRLHGRDIAPILDVLLAHTWSTINGKSWDLPVGYNERHICRAIVRGKRCGRPISQHGHRIKHPYTDGPNCYCHGDRREPPWELLTQDTASEAGCEWAYVIDPARRTMTVLECAVDGRHMVGMFGSGAPARDVVWTERAIVFLDNPEPDWEALS